MSASPSSFSSDTAFYDLLRSKNIDPAAFQQQSAELTLDSPLEDHVRWAFDHIYKVAYVEGCQFLFVKDTVKNCSFHFLEAELLKDTRYAIVLYKEDLYYFNAWEKSVIKLAGPEYEPLKSLCEEKIRSGKGRRYTSESTHAYHFEDDAQPLIRALTGHAHTVDKRHALPPGYHVGITRYIHGITHVSGAAMLVPVLENVFRKWGLTGAETLSPGDIHALSVAVLFHDAAREDEDEDRWDHESALMLYYYLRRVLQVSPQKAKALAQAVANKDLADGCALMTMTKDPGLYEDCGLLEMPGKMIGVRFFGIDFDELRPALQGRDALIMDNKRLYYVTYKTGTIKEIFATNPQMRAALARLRPTITGTYRLADQAELALICEACKRPTLFEQIAGSLQHNNAIMVYQEKLFFADYDSKTLEQIDANPGDLNASFSDTWKKANPAELDAIRSLLSGRERKKGYFYINEDQNGQISWGFDQSINEQSFLKTLAQILIHEADCLEIIRARAHFEAPYLDFYQQIETRLSVEDRAQALEELARLICETRTFIFKRGDQHGRTSATTKKQYEQRDALEALTSILNSQDLPLLSQLRTPCLPVAELENLIDIQAYDPDAPLTEDNLRRAMAATQLYARGIFTPTLRIKPDASNVSFELGKVFRRPGFPTPSSKADRMNKNGNPLRSISLTGYVAGLFSEVGFFIVGLDLAAVSQVAGFDVGSGIGKKAHLDRENRPSLAEIKAQLAAVHQKLRLGGDSVIWDDTIATHTELLYNITRYAVVYFSNDPDFCNPSINKAQTSAPFLKAVYCQQVYEQVYEQVKQGYIAYFGDSGLGLFISHFGEQKTLPLFEFSGLNNRIRQAPDAELSDDYLLAQWRKMHNAYTQSQLNNGDHLDLVMRTESIASRKISCMDDKYHGDACLLLVVDRDPLLSPNQFLARILRNRRALVLYKDQFFYVPNRVSAMDINARALPIPDEKAAQFRALKSRMLATPRQEADFETCELINTAIESLNKKNLPKLKVCYPADQYYSDALKQRIDAALAEDLEQAIRDFEDKTIEEYVSGKRQFKADNSPEEPCFQSQRLVDTLQAQAREFAIAAYEPVTDIRELFLIWYFVDQMQLTDSLHALHEGKLNALIVSELLTFRFYSTLAGCLYLVNRMGGVSEALKPQVAMLAVTLFLRDKGRIVDLLPVICEFEPRHYSFPDDGEGLLTCLLDKIRIDLDPIENLERVLTCCEHLFGPTLSPALLRLIQNKWETTWAALSAVQTGDDLLNSGQLILQTRLPQVLGDNFRFAKPTRTPFILAKLVSIPGLALATAGLERKAPKWIAAVVGALMGAAFGELVDRKRKAADDMPFEQLNRQVDYQQSYRQLGQMLELGGRKPRVEYNEEPDIHAPLFMGQPTSIQPPAPTEPVRTLLS